ncbi:hypothetical protein K443DRAFT_11222 [Laccaria amethystina LaAM-08-1]|uniref:Unplaced genomic scaffold K443scaffold_212, whole genome shotgun sequence n=1 Tax=Laccaria amethystina LaAM-08-1 TaxID=1095629 RepID=A0A0C9XD63_9AGAR|nr:hypothetical protein K443DRAFT_11222 [Laccaria amethystina LaAM-08-1]
MKVVALNSMNDNIVVRCRLFGQQHDKTITATSWFVTWIRDDNGGHGHIIPPQNQPWLTMTTNDTTTNEHHTTQPRRNNEPQPAA